MHIMCQPLKSRDIAHKDSDREEIIADVADASV